MPYKYSDDEKLVLQQAEAIRQKRHNLDMVEAFERCGQVMIRWDNPDKRADFKDLPSYMSVTVTPEDVAELVKKRLIGEE